MRYITPPILVLCVGFGLTAQADPVTIDITNAALHNGVYVGNNGSYTMAKTTNEEGKTLLSITAVSGNTGWTVSDLLQDPDKATISSIPWSGTRSGATVTGTIRVIQESASDPVSIKITETTGGITAAIVTVAISALSGDLEIAPSYHWFCGCANFDVLCASDDDCSHATPCPGHPENCAWHSPDGIE